MFYKKRRTSLYEPINSMQARSQDFAQEAGGGDTPNLSRSDQNHDHIGMPINKLSF